MQVTPLVIDGVMYVTAGANIFALEPETAKVLWKFSNTDMSRRGLAYWPGDAQTGARFYTGAGDGRMIAVDVKTGTLAADFGAGGSVDLKASVSVDGGKGSFALPSPPAVYRNIVITGGTNGEGAPANGAPVRRRPRVGCADGQDALDVPHRAAAGGAGKRNVAGRRVQESLRHECLGVHHR